MLKNAKILGTAFSAELLGRHEISLPPAGAKTNELTEKQIHTRGFVLVCIYMYYVIIVTTRAVSVKYRLHSAAFSRLKACQYFKFVK